MAMSIVNKPGAFERGKLKVGQYGPIMRELGILNITNLPAQLPHEGEVRVTDLSGPGTKVDKLTLEYLNGKSQHQAVIRQIQGLLTCDYCTPDDGTEKRVTWCSHLHYLLVKRLDSLFYRDAGRYMIPMVPSEGIYCPVHIGEPITNERNKSLDSLVPVTIIMGLRDQENQDDHIVIGYLRRNTISTADLRNMFTDWAIGNIENTRYYASTQCNSKKHDKLKNEKLSSFAQSFYPSMYGLCPPCILDFQNSTDKVVNPDDDAPDF